MEVELLNSGKMVELNGTESGNVQQTMFDYGMSYCVGRLHFCLSGLDITISWRVLWGENGDRYQQKKTSSPKMDTPKVSFLFSTTSDKRDLNFHDENIGALELHGRTSV